LRDYQKVGVEFLVSREHALLADDMGLGKTAQCSIAIAVLRRSERIGRTLIICPRALIRQWEQEAKHWAGLHITTIDGTPVMRKRLWESFPGVLMATPNIVLNDADVLSKCHFDLVVCDDVSMLKNPGRITTAIRNLPRKRSWCLTGTPLENRPEDFTNVMQFVYPGLFSAAERERAPSSAKIQQKVRPYFLRRRKIDCLKELPPKQFIGPIELPLEGAQLQAYRYAERQKWEEWEELQGAGIKPNKQHVFTLINALLQVCNFIDKPTRQSVKAEAMRERIEITLDTERTDVKAIVFSRYVKTLHFLKQEFSAFGPQVYHGGLSDRERQNVLDEFRTKGRLLLMSTKAGSPGLNLQEASYVFHFDSSWNPVDEMQAEDTDTLAATQWSLDELIGLLRPTSK
jgi:SNF2 family DNA or RNA helicase